MPEISESLSHKIGPLPAWGWGLAIGGAVIVAKMLTGRSAFGGGSTGTPVTVGSGGADNGTVDSTQITDLAKQLTDFQTRSNTFSSLQAQLIDAINRRATAMYYLNVAGRNLSDTRNKYSDGLINKASYDASMATYNKNYQYWLGQLDVYNKSITTLQTQATAYGAT